MEIVLERDFRLMNPDTGQIVARSFVDIAADVDIEFRLAKRDPQGNCHSGINRIQDELTYQGNNDMKPHQLAPGELHERLRGRRSGRRCRVHQLPFRMGSQHRWHRAQARIRGQHWDGQSVPQPHPMTHECGHWLNLPHTWSSSNSPNEPDNCDVDDGVEDTPLCLEQSVGFCDPGTHHLWVARQCPELHGIRLLQPHVYAGPARSDAGGFEQQHGGPEPAVDPAEPGGDRGLRGGAVVQGGIHRGPWRRSAWGKRSNSRTRASSV